MNGLAAAALGGGVNTGALGDPKTGELFGDGGVNSNSVHENFHGQSHSEVEEKKN